MRILRRILDLKFAKLWRLAWIGLKNPLLVFPTNGATLRTMEICDALFGEAHHKDNKANAFRHALWNILIAKRVVKILKNEQKAIEWAGRITSLHEELMPNPPLETEMDLHNNAMGGKYFSKVKTSSEDEIVSFLKREMEKAVQIKTVGDTENPNEVLVYLDDL